MKTAASVFVAVYCGLAAVGIAVAASSRGTDVMTWTDVELAPYVTRQLTEHPRFRGETVVFVALEQGAPAPVTNALVLALRDRVVDAVADRPGITIGWHAGLDERRADCARDATDYFIGLEVAPLIDRRHRVTLRVLDARDRSWVTGTTRSWEGRLSAAQRRAVEQSMVDEYFRGDRDAPFAASQSDMLAASLAHELACKLMRQTAGEYRIAVDRTSDPATPVPGAVELVRNNLAGIPSLRMAAHAESANAVLGGKAHHIDGDLYQYWITVTPTNDPAGERAEALPTISASAYVRLPNALLPSNVPAVTNVRMPASRSGDMLIEPLQVVEPRQRRACFDRADGTYRTRLVAADHTVGRGDCFLLQTRADRDSTIFLLNYQVNHGLVRLRGGNCGATSGVAARAGEALLFPTADDGRPAASAWQGQPGMESFYVVAASDDRAARELASVIDRLPTRCTLSASHGLDGPGLQAWLSEFGAVVAGWQHAIDWQGVRVRHVN